MKFSRWLPLLAAAPLALGACGRFSEAMTAHTDVVARAAGRELKVEEAAQLLAGNPQIPAEPQVVQALAEIWVDYTLLAAAVAEDSTLGAVDMEAFIEPAREQALLMKLSERVIRPDTSFTDEELAQRWASEGPGAEIRARHILLRAPAEATPAQRDSVQQLAAQLQQQAAGGADFAALATQYSQDPGSAARGGDLGFFSRGRMVAQFEEAAFTLQPGQVSQVVESPFGYHIIKVEERRQPELGEERERFRQFLVSQAGERAQGAFVDSIAAAANVEIQPGGLAVVREIATRPELAVKGRASERVIASYRGGTFTSGEFARFIRTQDARTQGAFAQADEEQVESAVQQLARRELLLAQAKQNDISLSRAEEDSIRTQARQAIRGVLQATGLNQLAGRRADAAQIDARVRQLIEAGVSGQAQLIPLGPLGFALRELYPNEVNEGTFPQVVGKVQELRGPQSLPAPGLPGQQPGVPQLPETQPQPQPAPDTAGR